MVHNKLVILTHVMADTQLITIDGDNGDNHMDVIIKIYRIATDNKNIQDSHHYLLIIGIMYADSGLYGITNTTNCSFLFCMCAFYAK